jgi:acyl-CoA thioester hydrolase
MPAAPFRLDFEVRDYECDLAGVVNNAVYQNYLEHARNTCVKALGIDYPAWVTRGIALVIVRAELDYLAPLRTGDRFYITVRIERLSPLRIGFQQDLFRLPDERPILRARFVGTAINAKGRPQLPKELAELFDRALAAANS